MKMGRAYPVKFSLNNDRQLYYPIIIFGLYYNAFARCTDWMSSLPARSTVMHTSCRMLSMDTASHDLSTIRAIISVGAAIFVVHALNFDLPSKAHGCYGLAPIEAHLDLLHPVRLFHPEWEVASFD